MKWYKIICSDSNQRTFIKTFKRQRVIATIDPDDSLVVLVPAKELNWLSKICKQFSARFEMKEIVNVR